jgi:predicted MPP superfamily phosphohydrolase
VRILTEYRFETGKLQKPCKLAVVSDLHNEPFEDIWPMIQGADALLVPGDISNRYRHRYEEGVRFLQEAAKRMPTFFSLGNHEVSQKRYRQFLSEVMETGAEILINRYVPFGEMWIGGWYEEEFVDAPDMMDQFEKLPGFRLLLCHKPDEYIKRLKNRNVDLVVCGHAHGGQVRIGQRGILAPGQGLFPKYTKGVHFGNMIISTGAGNPCFAPRINNPCEVLMIHLS